MTSATPERFREEEERLDRLFLENTTQDIDEFFEKNASPEFLSYINAECARIDALHTQGIMV